MAKRDKTQTLEDVLTRLNKQAQARPMAKWADDAIETDAGTDQPVGDVPGNAQPATTGAQAADDDRLLADVPGNTMDATVPDPSGSELAPNRGVAQSTSGEDPENITTGLPDSVPDPGTDTDATTDNTKIGQFIANNNALTKSANALISLLSQYVVDPAAKSANAQSQQAAEPTTQDPKLDKAAEALVNDIEQLAIHETYTILKQASFDADLVADYLDAYIKQAEGDDQFQSSSSSSDDDGTPASDLPPSQDDMVDDSDVSDMQGGDSDPDDDGDDDGSMDDDYDQDDGMGDGSDMSDEDVQKILDILASIEGQQGGDPGADLSGLGGDGGGAGAVPPVDPNAAPVDPALAALPPDPKTGSAKKSAQTKTAAAKINKKPVPAGNKTQKLAAVKKALSDYLRN